MKYLIFVSLLFSVFFSCNKAFDYENPYHVKKDFVNTDNDKCFDDKDCEEGYYCNEGKCINPCENYSCEYENQECIAVSFYDVHCECKAGYAFLNNKCEKINWEKVSAGNGYTCGIMNKKLYCWGNNGNDYKGALGLGNISGNGNMETPRKVNDDDWIDISCSGDYTCGITGNGKLFCWGNNYKKRVISGMAQGNIYTPEQVKLLDSESTWSRVFTNKSFNRYDGECQDCDNFYFTCALNTNHELYCWGNRDSYHYDGSDYSFYKVADKVTNAFVKDKFVWFIGETAGGDNKTYEKALNVFYYDENGEEEFNYKIIDTINKYDSVINLNFPQEDRIKETLSGIIDNGDNGEKFAVKYVSLTNTMEILCDTVNNGGNIEYKVGEACNSLAADKIDAGNSYACILTDKNIYCYKEDGTGNDDLEKIIMQPSRFYKINKEKSDWSFVSVGAEHICAIDENAVLYCMGVGNGGELGIGGLPQTQGTFFGEKCLSEPESDNFFCNDFVEVKFGTGGK